MDNETDDNLEVRLAQYERLIEATAPRSENPCRCTCDRCTWSRLRRPAVAA